jgi:hypothetical protein
MATPPIIPTNKVRTTLGAPAAVLGDADHLAAAFQAGTPVTLGGKLAGERVYLGFRHQTFDARADGVTTVTTGLDHILGESPNYPGHTIAAFLVDPTRLDDAPRLAEMIAKSRNAATARALAADLRAQAEEDRYTQDEG